MFLFVASFLALILGYFIYGSIVEKIFGASETKPTPAIKYADGVDFVPMSPLKIFLIQFLNIAGLGPVFGALMGAVYGPVCFFWIVLGSIFAGGVHDYLSGMLSLKFKGKSIVFFSEKFFGKWFKIFFLIGLSCLLIVVGAVFAVSPALMLEKVTSINYSILLLTIFLYYFFATLLPIDKIIGKFYPVFAFLLIAITFVLFIKLLFSGMNLPTANCFANMNPDKLPIFPLMFVSIACGAISGFHATQSPIMARCLTNEKHGRPIFYGAMITEGLVALVWATLGIAFYNGTGGLLEVINQSGAGGAVSAISNALLGKIGGTLTILSVIIFSITSGDTAFRSARLNLADSFNFSQKKIVNRLLLSIIVLAAGVFVSFHDYTSIWRYFAWSNQTLACITLWLITIYLRKKGKNYIITIIPALFMTSVCSCYILNAPIGFNLSLLTSKIISVIIAAFLLIFFVSFKKHKKNINSRTEKLIELQK